MSIAEEYLKELEDRRRRIEEGQERLRREFGKRDIKPPEMFENSSFMYMRSYVGDVGDRPFSGTVFWTSPDIAIEPLSHPGQATTQLAAGQAYRVRVRLRNRGDLAVPAAKVELFLVDPTLGFTTTAATNLTLGNVPGAWVPSGGNAVAELVWTVPPALSGHKCLFARAFSFSPLELPVDLTALNPTVDRHVAQLNLNIVGQAQQFRFNLVHAPNARMRIDLRPLKADELLRLGHPALAELRPAEKVPQHGWGGLAPIEPLKGGGGLTVERGREGVQVLAKERTRSLRLHSSPLAMGVPDLGLARGEAVGLHVTSTDERAEAVTGGITLVIIGE